MNYTVIDKKNLLKNIMENCETKFAPKEVEELCDCFMKQMIGHFERIESIQYEDYPLFRAKLSKSSIEKNSPKSPRADRIVVTLKFKPQKSE